MANTLERRRLLQLAGAGAATTVAGCSELSLSGGDGSELTVAIEPDAEASQELQESVQQGEITQQEAIQEQQQLQADAVDAFESRVDAESDDDLEILEQLDQEPLYLVDGSAEVLVDALRSGDITVLAAGELFEQIQQQAEQAQQQPPVEGDQPADGGEEPPSDEEVQEIDPEELEEALEEEAHSESD